MPELEIVSTERGPRPVLHMDERPYVSSHDGQRKTELVQGHLARARELVRLGRRACQCPAALLVAAETVDGMVVRCGVEKSLVTERRDPSSLAAHCLNVEGYMRCGSWRAQRDADLAGRGELVAAAQGD